MRAVKQRNTVWNTKQNKTEKSPFLDIKVDKTAQIPEIEWEEEEKEEEVEEEKG